VVVLEDLHWADDATLDWLRYLSRRIASSRAVVIATYRDDAPPSDNPLRGVIGQIATQRATRRMALRPLSAEAVHQMAGDTDADELPGRQILGCWRPLPRSTRPRWTSASNPLYERPVAQDHPWLLGALTTWLHRLGVPVRAVSGLPEPFRQELAGHHHAAAEWWHEARCPFEEAVALTCPGEPDACVERWTCSSRSVLFRRCRWSGGRLRQAGQHAVPHGPRPATRAHPDGLTDRGEVLTLLCDGLPNAAIARRLFISERTMHHHVSAILRKLGVRSRADVASATDRLGVRPT
jgi:DNA-binding CsgD family transcriptional regulator